MAYEKVVAEFKAEVKAAIKESRSEYGSYPKKNSRRLEISVINRIGEEASVELNYSEEYYRMFGRHDFVTKVIFTGDIKEACKIARDLKKEIALPISYLEYEPIGLLA